jgi:hypothetical protein
VSAAALIVQKPQGQSYNYKYLYFALQGRSSSVQFQSIHLDFHHFKNIIKNLLYCNSRDMKTRCKKCRSDLGYLTSPSLKSPPRKFICCNTHPIRIPNKNTTFSVSVNHIFKLINVPLQGLLKIVQYVVVPLNLLGSETELSRTGNSLATFPLINPAFKKKKNCSAAGLIKIEPQTAGLCANTTNGFIKIETEGGLDLDSSYSRGQDLDSTYSPASLHSPSSHSPPTSPAGGKIKV